MKCGYCVTTGAAVALAAATAKSVLGIRAGATFGVDLRGFTLGFDGVTASAVPVLVELCYATWATQPPGTLSTSVTPAQNAGRVTASGCTAARDWTTTQPTVLTPLREMLLTPNGGLLVVELALDKSWDSAPNEGFALRCTAPAIVNLRASMDFERA